MEIFIVFLDEGSEELSDHFNRIQGVHSYGASPGDLECVKDEMWGYEKFEKLCDHIGNL